MYKLLSAFLFLLSASSALAVEIDRPMTAEDEIMMRELAWAETAMAGYKRHHGDMPLRSSINAVHIHTEEWRNDSIDSIRKSSSSQDKAERGNLRKRNNAIGGDR
jgi:hypothetical protein